ncbi:hypothetical protein [Pantoea sp. 1.19]|uniref:hypothetical protein n=1 Tax=Pantoea sp. 1.19 TaxID=1925589 RepID=UPI001F0ADFFE|nr:hypothetical protein [Pantoea sp. 1.19]
MTLITNKPPVAARALDRSDERVQHSDGLAGVLRAFISRIKTGDLGMLPVLLGLILIATVFSVLNPVFLAPNNLVNMLFDCATVGFISLGIVCVLMLGEIDLSVGSMSGLASALIGVLWVNLGWPVAGGRCHRGVTGGGSGGRAGVRAAVYPPRHAEFCCHAGRPAGAAGTAALYPRTVGQY